MIGCDHINLVKVLGYISAGLSGLFLVLEFCDRGSLREMLDAEVEAATDQLGNPGSGSAKEGEAPSDPQPGCLPLSVALHGAEGLCAGLLYLHDEKDMIHRDIKSSNVMLTGTRAALVMKLGDFGSAAKDPHVLANAVQPPKYFGNQPNLPASRAVTPISLSLMVDQSIFGTALVCSNSGLRY